MSTFEVWVRKIDDVRDHPKADRLSILKVLGYEAIVNKLPDGSPRFQAGDLIVYIPEASMLPEDVLKENGYWMEEKVREDGTVKPAGGVLAGKLGNRVKIAMLRGLPSQGLVLPIVAGQAVRGDLRRAVREGDDLADFFGVTKYEPPIPSVMGGDLVGVPEMSFSYDIENWQNFPGFLDNDTVVATEKLHGTNFRICWHPNVQHPQLFGSTGSVGITSKTNGIQGKMFATSRANLGPLWVRTEADIAEDAREAKRWKWQGWGPVYWFLCKIGRRPKKPRNFSKSNVYVRVAMEQGLIEKVETMGRLLGKRVDLFGEVFGAGVQKLGYGEPRATFRAFDIAIDRVIQDEAEKARLFADLGVERVPVLYTGPWDEAVLIRHRDGKTVIGNGANIREGVVITAVGDQAKREAPDGVHRLRPFLKMVSPAYLKQEDGSEIQ